MIDYTPLFLTVPVAIGVVLWIMYKLWKEGMETIET